MALALRILVVCVLSLSIGCAGGSRNGPPPVPSRARGQAIEPELEQAIASWHDADDLEPLRAWVKRHPQHAAAELWREVVALHSYESGEPGQEPGDDQLRSIAREYPETLAGQVATITLVGDRLGSLYAAVPGLLATDFLDGGDAWTRAEDGTKVADVDLSTLAERHGTPIRDAMAQAMLGDRCSATMGYCNWWVARYPSDPRTASIATEIAQTWYRRGHPHWEGGRHARCAYRCAKECRERATPLDDGCYAPCYSTC
ncbi:MAG: hypothetical protein IAG13_31095 [Deltaproteobacteria bacterium]|nr:hypothetical protein [Nannocystaceae bacterium]